jgi:hypothetical protein
MARIGNRGLIGSDGGESGPAVGARKPLRGLVCAPLVAALEEVG